MERGREGGRKSRDEKKKRGSSPLLPYERVFTPVRDKKRETNAPPPSSPLTPLHKTPPCERKGKATPRGRGGGIPVEIESWSSQQSYPLETTTVRESERLPAAGPGVDIFPPFPCLLPPACRASLPFACRCPVAPSCWRAPTPTLLYFAAAFALPTTDRVCAAVHTRPRTLSRHGG